MKSQPASYVLNLFRYVLNSVNMSGKRSQSESSGNITSSESQEEGSEPSKRRKEASSATSESKKPERGAKKSGRGRTDAAWDHFRRPEANKLSPKGAQERACTHCGTVFATSHIANLKKASVLSLLAKGTSILCHLWLFGGVVNWFSTLPDAFSTRNGKTIKPDFERRLYLTPFKRKIWIEVANWCVRSARQRL